MASVVTREQLVAAALDSAVQVYGYAYKLSIVSVQHEGKSA